MKKIWLGLLFFLSSLTFLLAGASPFIFGIKAGGNLASISVSTPMVEMGRFRNLFGLTGGIFLGYKLGPVTIQPELIFARRGTRYSTFMNGDFYQVEWHNNYLEALVLLKWTFPKAGTARPFVLGGPSYGSLIKSESVIHDATGEQIATVDSRDYFRKGELAAVFGGGMEFRVHGLRAFVEVRYHLGLSNVARLGMEVDWIKNRGLSFLAGLSL